jgi:hypothetical protein
MSRGMHLCQKVEQRACSLRVRVITAAVAEGWDHAAPRREQLNDRVMWQILQEVGNVMIWKMFLIVAPSTEATGFSGNLKQ